MELIAIRLKIEDQMATEAKKPGEQCIYACLSNIMYNAADQEQVFISCVFGAPIKEGYKGLQL